MRKVLITGTTGFVGAVLCDRLAAEGYNVRAAVRTPPITAAGLDDVDRVAIGRIDGTTDWGEASTPIQVGVPEGVWPCPGRGGKLLHVTYSMLTGENEEPDKHFAYATRIPGRGSAGCRSRIPLGGRTPIPPG